MFPIAMMPIVTTPDQAAACLNAMRYPPSGKRGYSGSARVYNYGLNRPDDPDKVPVLCFLAQIEDAEGVKNAGEIASVEGVDVLFVGPSELGILNRGYHTIISESERLLKRNNY